MIVLLGFYKRRPGTSWEEFSDHWRDVHGPLLRETPESKAVIRRYVQHHIRPNPDAAPDEAPDYDGFSESWYRSMDDRRALWTSETFKKVIIPDERSFLDMDATRLLALDKPNVVIGENVLVDGDVITFY